MPARLIRDGLLDSERVCALPLEARWLFVTIVLVADDLGLFDAAPFALMRKAELQRDLGLHLLQVLADADLIRLYEHLEFPKKRFGFVPRYGQRLRLAKLKHPLPPLALIADDPQASRKIKHLAAKLSATCGTLRPEAEAEVEEEKKRKLSEVTLSPSVAPSASQKAPKAAKKATPRRLTSRRSPTVEEWPIPRDLKDWGREKCPLVDLMAETAAFRDHEFAKAKSDWPATWRSWMRKEQKRLAELQKRHPVAAKSFRERDADHARAEAAKWGGGLAAARDTNILDMEPTHERIDSD